MAWSPDLKLGRKRKRSLLTTQLRPDFVHPAGPGELPWAWRLADTLSTPRANPETQKCLATERPKAQHPTEMEAEAEAKVQINWEPFFREGDERTLPEKLMEKSALPWAWRLPFCEPWNSLSQPTSRARLHENQFVAAFDVAQAQAWIGGARLTFKQDRCRRCTDHCFYRRLQLNFLHLSDLLRFSFFMQWNYRTEQLMMSRSFMPNTTEWLLLRNRKRRELKDLELSWNFNHFSGYTLQFERCSTYQLVEMPCPFCPFCPLPLNPKAFFGHGVPWRFRTAQFELCVSHPKSWFKLLGLHGAEIITYQTFSLLARHPFPSCGHTDASGYCHCGQFWWTTGPLRMCYFRGLFWCSCSLSAP